MGNSGIEPVSQFLCFCHIADIGEGIGIALVGDAVGVEYMLHQFPAVYVDLDIEREPCLYLNEHEAEFPVQIVEVIVEAFGIGRSQEMLSFPADNFCGSTGFQCLQDTDETFIHRV